MCGIAGVFSPAGRITPEDVAAVGRMTAALLHRGPDDAGFFSDTHIALGHRRLSIIDLSAAGRQPLGNEDATVQVVCNGEIYNYRELTRELVACGHRFLSLSDTEVIVHGYEQWGMDGLLRRLRGMFAFVLYDARAAVCYAVRDRIGIKALYYALFADGRCAFASEVKALPPGELDAEAVQGFLLLGAVPHPLTWRKNIRCLEPGSYAGITDRGFHIARYWSAGDAVRDHGADVLTTAIRQHLISDAPLGVFLSSGVDSIGLVALAQREGVRVRTLTVVFDEAKYNEDTSGIARHFGTEHTEIRVTADDFLAELPHFLSVMDQPTADGLNTFFVSRAARAAGLKTVLSGLGGDEVFRGYRHYRWLEKYGPWLRAFGRLPLTARRALAGVVTGSGSWSRLRGLADATNASLYMTMRGFFSPRVVERLTGRRIEKTAEDARPFGDAGAFQLHEMNRYLHDQLLRDADVFGMAWSLEIRVPYLDHEVVEWAITAPDSRHIRPGVNKPVLVDTIHDDLVLAAARRPKTGFVFPLEQWMRRNSDELRERAMQADYLDRKEIGKLWAAFEAGRMNAARAWALVVTGSKRNGEGG